MRKLFFELRIVQCRERACFCKDIVFINSLLGKLLAQSLFSSKYQSLEKKTIQDILLEILFADFLD